MIVRTSREEAEQYGKTLRAGHVWNGSARRVSAPFSARAGSHDDGPLCGLFLGGLGTPVCSRNLEGRFSRWHLQSGYHVNQIIDEAFAGFHWNLDGTCGYFRLAESGPAQFSGVRKVHSLFPVTREYYRPENVPLELVAEFFSPLVPGDADATTLPVWYVSLTVQNNAPHPLEAGATLFWPNFLGWRQQPMTSMDRPERCWPSQTHAGNSAAAVPSADLSPGESVVLQQRRTRFHRPRIRSDMDGQVALYTWGPANHSVTEERCFKAEQNLIERAPRDQGHTLAWAEAAFARSGRLPETGLSWVALWHEALGSAIARSTTILPGESERFDFAVVMDLPLVQFGGGRTWRRRYCARYGSEATRTLEIARHAATHRDSYRRAIDRWHRSVLDGSNPLPASQRGAMINELYFVNGGGTVWVSDWAPQPGPEGEEEPPLLGPGEHTAILEGYDTGYYYYNTADLWPYSWYAIWNLWPDFSRQIFRDLLKTIPLHIPEKKMIYRTDTLAPVLVPGKIPHDLGSVMDDPWHRINGYQMRDDSNLWKDHNPAFILSFFLERRLSGENLTLEEWGSVREAALFMFRQAEDSTSLPLHDEFGDSTWDNLGVRGYAAYSGSFTIGSLAALIRWSEEFQDRSLAEECRNRMKRALSTYMEVLWNGEYFRISDRGKYASCVMADGILGFFLADLAGLGDLVQGPEVELLRSHLEAVHRYCFRQYHNGRYGPLLVAAPGSTRFTGDGGDELQVNEVLPGSAWMTVAMMYHYGLPREASEIAEALTNVIYTEGGLQFRTPAAWNSEGQFRAPMNMRPLSVWLVEAVFRHGKGDPHYGA
ncbi:MAG: hypothetical protein EA427_05115 [Spirochaetaceae bacterium]|nr:MAG: hypothetical protein EA427_05115 [Spirochaetaceae bacterium]